MRLASVPFLAFSAVLAAAAPGNAQQSVVLVDFTGASIPSLNTNPPDVIRTSVATIFPTPGYRFAFNPIVQGTGILGAPFVPQPTPLGDVVNTFSAGQQRFLFGAVRNPPGTIPTALDNESLNGTFSGLSLSFTFRQEILADGRCRSGIYNISKPLFVGFNFISGGAVIETWTPPPPVRSEFQFEGDLLSVRQSGAAIASGPAKLRYLDDAAFGPILGGIGQEDSFPAQQTPHGVTAEQSGFATTTAFGLPPVGGVVDMVYRTSPTRSVNFPGDSARRRGVGLALWPANRDNWPEDRNGQWTMVWDILIPQDVWDAGGSVVLLEDNHHNNAAADAIIRIVDGQARLTYWASGANATVLSPVQPGQWFRLALSNDHYRQFASRVFVNGQFMGASGSGWVYASCKQSDPRWGDLSSANPEGTPVEPATWNSWGQFPSPWAKSAGTSGAPMAATICLFADLQGRGESVYLANFAYTDQAMADAAVGALGGPNGLGIFYPRGGNTCTADFDGANGVGVPDIFAFLSAWFAQDPRADVDGTPGIGVPDIFAFLSLWFAGC